MTANEVFTNQVMGVVTSGGTTAPATGTVESWTVNVSASFPAAVPGTSQFRVVDPATGKSSETILISNAPGGTGVQTWPQVTRGAEGTTPVAHSAGFTIENTITAGVLESFAAASQSFALANGTYQDLLAWQVTGQTDTCGPFKLTAGSQTYSNPAYPGQSVQGPAFWLGYNTALLSGETSSASNGAIGMVVYADAGDTNNGSGAHGLEFGAGSFRTPNGAYTTNAFEVIGINDNTNTVNTTIRCGTGSSGSYTSNIVFQTADASTVFCEMNATNGVAFGHSAFAQVAASPVFSVRASSGNAAVNVSSAAAGNAAVNYQAGGVTKWSIFYYDPAQALYFVNEINAAPHAWFTPGATPNAASTTFASQLTVQDNLIVSSGAALATNATHGFLYVPTCAGVPAGTPAAEAGSVPIVIDTADGKLYAYVGGAWKAATLS